MSAIQGGYQSYIDQFPRDVPIKAAQGALVTVALSLFAGSSAPVALLGGAIAATATLVEAVTRPIIRSIFPGHVVIPICMQICMAGSLVLGMAEAAAPWVGVSYTISSSLLMPAVAFIALNENFYQKNTGMALVF